jgi:hypothetical protein
MPEKRTKSCMCITSSGILPPVIRKDAPMDVHAGSLACQWSVHHALVTASPKITVRTPSVRRRDGFLPRGEAAR